MTDTEVHFFDDQFLGFEGSVALPLAQTPEGCFPLDGRFAFFGSGATVVHVLAQIDAESGALLDYVLLTLAVP